MDAPNKVVKFFCLMLFSKKMLCFDVTSGFLFQHRSFLCVIISQPFYSVGGTLALPLGKVWSKDQQSRGNHSVFLVFVLSLSFSRLFFFYFFFFSFIILMTSFASQEVRLAYPYFISIH